MTKYLSIWSSRNYRQVLIQKKELFYMELIIRIIIIHKKKEVCILDTQLPLHVLFCADSAIFFIDIIKWLVVHLSES